MSRMLRILRRRQPLTPAPWPFTLYRGVAGVEPERRIRGLSWTRSLEVARSFAQDRARWRANPGVYEVTICERDVLAYRKGEEEFIVMLSASARPVRVE